MHNEGGHGLISGVAANDDMGYLVSLSDMRGLADSVEVADLL
jgi:hypothetical protein